MTWYQKFIIDGHPTTPKGFMSEEYFKKLVPLFPPDLHGKVILDLACNAGFVSYKLAAMGAHVTGIEKNPLYFEQAQYISYKLSPPPINLVLGDIETYDLQQFDPDLVIFLSVINHLNDPQAMVIKLSLLNSDVIASFRLSEFHKWQNLFLDRGFKAVKEAYYAKKRAVYLRKP